MMPLPTSVMRFLLGGISICLVSVLQGAISIQGFTSVTNDRFANDDSFIMSSYDLSGVAISSSGRWVTMISENVFLSANHFFPSNGTSVTFYGSNDANSVTATRSVLSSQRIGTTDIRIGVLNNPLGEEFSFYDFATEDITSFNTGPDSFINAPYAGLNAYIFGRSPSTFSVSQDIAVGRNVLDTWATSTTVSGSTGPAIVSNVNAESDNNYVSYEAALSSGDSSAPMFVDTGSGSLTMVGTNWFIGTDSGGAVVQNGQFYLGNYDAEIQAYIDAHPVPEPATYVLLSGALALGYTIARRRRSVA